MVNYSHITPEAGMVMKKASGDDLPSGRVPGRASDLPATMAVATDFFWNFCAISRVFPSGCINRRKGGARGGPHLHQARPSVGARLGRVWDPCGPPAAPLRAS